MADFIRPDPAPLPLAITTTVPVVTMVGGMCLNVVPQPPVTTSSASLPVTTSAVVVTAAITLITTTSPAVVTTTAPPVTSAVVSMIASIAVRVSEVEPNVVPANITPHIGAVSTSQLSLAPTVEATGTTPAAAAGGV